MASKPNYSEKRKGPESLRKPVLLSGESSMTNLSITNGAVIKMVVVKALYLGSMPDL